MKIVINTCYGGFTPSPKALMILDAELGVSNIGHRQVSRHDPILVRVVEQLGKEASGECASLVVVEIPDDRYYIEEYDGWEAVWTPSNIPWIVPEKALKEDGDVDSRGLQKRAETI